MRRQPHTTIYNIINVKHTKIMKLEKAKQICELWNSNKTKVSQTDNEAILVQDHNGKLSVEIVPIKSNDGHTFYDVCKLADIERAFGVNSFLYLDSETGKIVAEIF